MNLNTKLLALAAVLTLALPSLARAEGKIRVAEQFGVPIRVIKAVSDRAQDDAITDWRTAIKQAEHAVANGQIPPHHHAPRQ